MYIQYKIKYIQIILKENYSIFASLQIYFLFAHKAALFIHIFEQRDVSRFYLARPCHNVVFPLSLKNLPKTGKKKFPIENVFAYVPYTQKHNIPKLHTKQQQQKTVLRKTICSQYISKMFRPCARGKTKPC